MIANVASDVAGGAAPMGNPPMGGATPSNGNKTMLLVVGLAIVLIGAWYIKKEFIDKPAEMKAAKNEQ